MSTVFMPAAAILFAVALFFTATTLSAKADLDSLNLQGNANAYDLNRVTHIFGLNIAACVTAWIAYAGLIVGAIISRKKSKM